jgi:hypothetical protein
MAPGPQASQGKALHWDKLMYQESRRTFCALLNQLQAVGQLPIALIQRIEDVSDFCRATELRFHSGQKLRQIQQCRVLHCSNFSVLVDHHPSVPNNSGY